MYGHQANDLDLHSGCQDMGLSNKGMPGFQKAWELSQRLVLGVNPGRGCQDPILGHGLEYSKILEHSKILEYSRIWEYSKFLEYSKILEHEFSLSFLRVRVNMGPIFWPNLGERCFKISLPKFCAGSSGNASSRVEQTLGTPHRAAG